METNLNFKSSVCTSREQSERLLALGLKKETADMYLYIEDEDIISVVKPYCEIIEEIFDLPVSVKIRPAWSLDRLRELIPENIFTGIRNQWHRVMYNGILTYEEGDDSLVSFREENIYDRCISCIEWLIKKGYFNKKYLEE